MIKVFISFILFTVCSATGIAQQTVTGASKSILPYGKSKFTAAFAAQKGQLRWPVDHGHLMQPSTKMLLVPCTPAPDDGVRFGIANGSEVKAVFDGTVSAVFEVEGNKIVLVAHGTFYSVYNFAGTIKVHKGQQVRTSQPLGTVSESDDSTAELEFQLWQKIGKKSRKLPPVDWLVQLK